MYPQAVTFRGPIVPPNLFYDKVLRVSGWELTSFEITKFTKALPQFAPRDTLWYTDTGNFIHRTNWSNLIIVSVPEEYQIEECINRLNESPVVDYAEPNYGITSNRQGGDEFTPNDRRFHKQWNMKNQQIFGGQENMDVKATFAWAKTTGNPIYRVGIVSGSGVYGDHEDLMNKLVAWDPDDHRSNHATIMAGIIGAVGNNNLGIAGMDWNNRITSRVFEFGNVASCVDAIDRAMNDNVKVINNSWGWRSGWSTSIKVALQEAWKSNILLVHANPTDYSPGLIPNVYGSYLTQIASFNWSGVRSNFFVINPYTDLSAPGGDDSENDYELILSTLTPSGTGGREDEQEQVVGSQYTHTGNPISAASPPKDRYGWNYGTSSAAAHVSGMATLLLAYNDQLGRYPSLYNYDLEWIMKLSADSMGSQKEIYGHGRLNAKKALSLLEEPYQLVHHTANLNQEGDSSRLVYFDSDPFPPGHRSHGWGANWYLVTCYKLEGSYTPPVAYDGNPWAWLSQTGYSGLDPAAENYEGVNESISPTHVSLSTYFWRIDYIWNGSIWLPQGDWAPYPPEELELVGMSILGKAPPLPPTAPTGLWGAYNPLTESVDLEWDRNPEFQQVDYYQLDRSDEDGEFYILQRKIWDPGSGDKVEWIDREIEPGLEFYRYRVKAHNSQGWGPYCSPIIVWIEEGPLRGGGEESVPSELTLEPNYPNPFNPSTQIRFGLPANSRVRMQIMNIRGQTVRVLVDEDTPAGWHTVTWDGKNESGRDVASGIYLYIIEADNKRILKRMTIIR